MKRWIHCSDSLQEVKFKPGLRTETDQFVISIMKYKSLYRASALDKGTNEIVAVSPDYVKKESLNNFLSKYGIKLVF